MGNDESQERESKVENMADKLVSRCVYEDNAIRYFDKEGNELHDGDIIKYGNGRTERLYLTKDGELGTDATNPKWIGTGRAVACEYGIYPLTVDDLREIQVIEAASISEEQAPNMKIKL